MNHLVLGILTVACAACAAGPEPIRWGTDTCEQCRMVLDDKRFGAELQVGGRTYKFDGVDELGKYMVKHPGGTPYVVDAGNGTLVQASKAIFLASPDLRGPMGGHVVAFASKEDAQRFADAQQLKSVAWPTAKQALDERR
jgi:copper chaperone NosL